MSMTFVRPPFSGVPSKLAGLTGAQGEALKWLRERNGDGMFDNSGVLVAAGERAPVMRATWNKLRDAGLIEFYNKKRVRIVGIAQ